PNCLDERRPGLIAGCRDVPHERRRFQRYTAIGERTDDQQPLSGTQVEPDTDRELAVLPQACVDIGRREERYFEHRRRHGFGPVLATAPTGRYSAVKIAHASIIVRPAANTGAVGANVAAKNPPRSGGSEFANAAMLEPMPRISPCT